MFHKVLRGVILFLALAVPARAHAATIGVFGWDYDALFGSTFSVFNDSTSTFEDVFVDLYAPGATDPFQTLDFGTVAPNDIEVQIEDLSLLLVPDDLNRAILRLLFNDELVTAELLATSLDGDLSSLAGGGVAITAEETVVAPEPSSLVLMASGAAALLIRRRRRGKR